MEYILYRNLNINNLPLFIANYFTKENGSVFTILPWFGYSASGAFLATIFFKHTHKKYFKIFTIIALFAIGYFLISYSSPLLRKISMITNIELFKLSANYNYLFTRLGNVLIIFGIFYALERFLKQSIVVKIGEKTLSIYVIHFIILFGSYTGYGLKRFFDASLNPIEVIFGAILFMITSCFLSFHYAKTNAFVYNLVRKLINKFKN